MERCPAHSKESHHCHHHDHSSLLPPRPTKKHGIGWICLSKCVSVLPNALLFEPTSLNHTFSSVGELPEGRLSAFPLLYSLCTLHTPVVSAQSGTRLDCRHTSSIFPVSQWTEAEAGERGCLIHNRVTNKWCSLGLNLGVSVSSGMWIPFIQHVCKAVYLW